MTSKVMIIREISKKSLHKNAPHWLLLRLSIPLVMVRIGLKSDWSAFALMLFGSFCGGGVCTPESELSPESSPELSDRPFSGVWTPSELISDPSQYPLSRESPPESVESSRSITSSFLRRSERSNFERSDFLRRRRFFRASRSWNSGCGWSTCAFRKDLERNQF